MRRFMLRWLTAALLAIGATAAGAEQRRPRQQDAFARIGGGRYAPFYSYVITPHAVVARQKVFCAFQNDRGRPIAMVYDIAGRTWSQPVKASEVGLGGDTHGNPSIYLDRRGHVHLFYGCHGRAMRHTRSVKPYDIAEWHEQAPPTPRATYPQSMPLADGTVRLFYRAGGHMEPWSMRTSKDDGKTWGEAQRIIEMRLDPPDRLAAAYACFFPGVDGKTIHCFWNHKDDNASRVNRGRVKKHPWRPLKYKGLHEAVYRYNIYYIRRQGDGRWVNAAGEAVTLPVSKARADAQCMVFDSGDEFAYPGRIGADRQNRPYIRISTGVRDWTTGKTIVPMRSQFAALRGGKWQVSDALPSSWPAEAREIVSAAGLAAYGPQADERWYIHARRRKDGSGIYLYGTRRGYATRKGGPADCRAEKQTKP